jgi:Zn-dependent metalloprotease
MARTENGTCRILVSLAAAAALLALSPGDAQAQRREARFSLPAGAAPVEDPTAPATAVDEEVEQAIGRLTTSIPSSPSPTLGPGQQSLAAVQTARSSDGYLRSLSAPPGRAFALPRGASAGDPGSAAAAFLRANRTAFGVSRRGVTLRADRTRESRGVQSVRLAQEFQGIPVFGAAAIVEIGPRGVEFVLSDLARDRAVMYEAGFDTTPSVSEAAARAAAVAVTPRALAVSDLRTEDPNLMIYEPSVVGNGGPSRLVWHVRLTSDAGTLDEVVLVDAHTGKVAFHFSQIMEARNRQIYDAANVSGSMGTLRRSEGQAAYGISDVDQAYDNAGDAYNFFSGTLGRDSINGAGMALVIRARYCESGDTCPFPNAYWTSAANEMRFGQGYASGDDVVAHEFTHGITSHEANLIYWNESGAINESISDIFGEFVDLTNGRGNDAAGYRWSLGEESPIGVMRSMSNPPAYGDPDRRFSSSWYAGWGDNRGVHINSGVGNKLAYLLTDGGTFNGQTITGQGITNVARLFYDAQANLLVPGSDYNDLFLALRRAAVRVGWTIAARVELEEAARAVEIDVAAGEQLVFSDGFEGSFPGSWAVYDDTGVGTRWGRSTAYTSSGSYSAWCAGGGANKSPSGGTYKPNMQTWMIYGPFSLANASHAWAEFDLLALVEADYDLGYWGVSTDGVNFNGVVFSPAETGGLSGWWGREKFDFRGLAGQSQVWFAFLFQSDSSAQYDGVYVDNVAIYRAGNSAPFGNFDTPANGTGGVTGAIAVTGWALDDREVTSVKIYRNPLAGEPTQPNGKVYIGDANFVPGARPDVDSSYAVYPLAYRAGWGYMLLTNFLPNGGNGTTTLHAYASDAQGQATLLGSKTITCSNATATKPFGTIDVPGQGETVSGVINNWGWALTPQTASIPTNGSTIWVYVDGVAVGNPTYNLYRSDIGTLFPGYANSGGAVGYLTLDTRTLTNGIHTIQWVVTDNQGRADGIGSRYFWVQN